jgi:serine/threonine protein kinase
MLHLKHDVPLPTNGVLLIPQIGEKRWILPTDRLYQVGARDGDTICIIPTSHFGPSPPRIQAPVSTLAHVTVRLADFPKIRDLALGFSSDVYCARDPRTGGVVVVKTLRSFDRLSFMREMEVLAGVNHPTLLGFRGWVPPNGADPPSVLMEFMPRGSLAALLELSRPPPEWDNTRKFIVLYGISIGMLVLHTKGIIHRALKLQNVFLNEQFEPKVADFRLSKVAGENGDGASFENDVYAFGTVIWATVTGKVGAVGEAIPAFVGSNWRELITACRSEKPTSRPTFKQIVMRMWSAEFLDASIDRKVVVEYQKKTLPEEFHSREPIPVVESRLGCGISVYEGQIIGSELKSDSIVWDEFGEDRTVTGNQ